MLRVELKVLSCPRFAFYSTEAINGGKQAGAKAPLKRGSRRIPPSKTRKQKEDEVESTRKANQDRNLAAEVAAKQKQLANPWLIRAGIVVERPQILIPEPEPWLKQYIEWRHRWDAPIVNQMPHINILDEDLDQMRQREADEKKAAAAREKMLATESAEEKRVRLEKEERTKRMATLRKQEEEAKAEKPGPRITEADKTNDLHSLRRKLEKKLYLIVKEKSNPSHKEPGASAWRFPQGNRLDGEPIRTTAERELVKETGNKLETYFVGNGPITFHTAELNPNQQKQFKAFGVKTFFQYAYFLNGNVTLDSNLADYAWVSRDELKGYLSPSYFEAVNAALAADGEDEEVPLLHYRDPKKDMHA